MVAFEKPRENPWTRLVIGFWILAAGVVLWLDRIGRIDADDYMMWWPVALIAVGLAHIPRRQWVGAGIWITIGLYLLLPLVNLPQFPLWRIFSLWPLLIAFGGVTLLMQAFRPVPPNLSRDAGFFSAIAVMGGNERLIASPNFVGGDAVAVMGGCDIDFTGARIVNEAILDVVAFWGGIEVTVPRDWNVVMRVAEVLAGVTNSAVGAPAGAPRLIIRGSAIMGGVEVKYAAEEKV